jgi:hypothetical protein
MQPVKARRPSGGQLIELGQSKRQAHEAGQVQFDYRWLAPTPANVAKQACTEIRQRGPVGLAAQQCKKPCGIATVMHGAELAWRNELAATTVADLIRNAPAASARRAARWLGERARPGLARPGR